MIKFLVKLFKWTFSMQVKWPKDGETTKSIQDDVMSKDYNHRFVNFIGSNSKKIHIVYLEEYEKQTNDIFPECGYFAYELERWEIIISPNKNDVCKRCLNTADKSTQFKDLIKAINHFLLFILLLRDL